MSFSTPSLPFFFPFLSQQIRVNGSDYLKCDHIIADHNLEKKTNKNKKNLAYVLYFTLDIEITSLNMFVLWVMDG